MNRKLKQMAAKHLRAALFGKKRTGSAVPVRVPLSEKELLGTGFAAGILAAACGVLAVHFLRRSF